MKDKIKLLEKLANGAQAPLHYFALTGSSALQVLGMPGVHHSDDLDVIAFLDDRLHKFFAALQETAPGSHTFDGGNVKYSFIYQGVKVDVFEEKMPEPVILVGGIQVAPIGHVIGKKSGYARAKDAYQFSDMAISLLHRAKEITGIIASKASREAYELDEFTAEDIRAFKEFKNLL